MRKSLLIVVLVVAALTSACGKVQGTGDKGYIESDGVITQLAVADRKPVGAVAGETIAGKQVSLADDRGKVVVVNVWGSWCPPCRAEASTLAAVARQLMPTGVVFLGINNRDPSRANSRAFERRYDVPYPSIYDPAGRTLLAFRGTLLPTSIPSTVIIDRNGKVAASILGAVTSKQTLIDLVQDAAK